MVLGVLRNHCGCAGVLARVMVVEPEVQLPLEVGQPVPAIPLQLGPCPPCDRDAVAHQVGSVDATGPTGGIHRLLVNERSKLTRLQHLILTRLSDGKAPRRAALI